MTNNGTNFCCRKHRLQWVKEHNYTKKDWKRIHEQEEKWMMSLGSQPLENYGHHGGGSDEWGIEGSR